MEFKKSKDRYLKSSASLKNNSIYDTFALHIYCITNMGQFTTLSCANYLKYITEKEHGLRSYHKITEQESGNHKY